MSNCKDCLHYEVCQALEEYNDIPKIHPKQCGCFKPKADYVEVVRCKDCVHAIELDKHCEINRNFYKHCTLLRGEETDLVWHKYKKYYKSYSIIEPNDFCNCGERKESEVRE